MLTVTLNESWKDRTMLRAWVPVMSQDLMAQGGVAGHGCPLVADPGPTGWE